MNFANEVSKKQCAVLSRLGINCHRIKSPLESGKMATINDVYVTVLYCREKVLLDDYDIIDEIAESRFFKKETLFKGIWIYKSNIIPYKLYYIITKDGNKKKILIERFDLMLNALATFTNNKISILSV